MAFAEPGNGDWLSELLKVIGLPNYQYQDTQFLTDNSSQGSPFLGNSMVRQRADGGPDAWYQPGQPQYDAGVQGAQIDPQSLIRMFAQDNAAAPQQIDPRQLLQQAILGGGGRMRMQ